MNKKSNQNNKIPSTIEEARFKMGDIVKSEITNIQGSITSIRELLTGCLRYVVQPLAKDNRSVDPVYAEDIELTLIKSSDRNIPRLPFRFRLGQTVIDVVTRKKMVVTGRSWDIAGYNQYLCRLTKEIKGEEKFKSFYFEEAELLPVKRWFWQPEIKVGYKIKERAKKIINSPICENRVVLGKSQPK
jgi:hypothetical protein